MKTSALDPQLARSILQVTPDVVMVLEPAGCIEYVNPAFEVLTGLSIDEVRGQEWCSTCLPHRDRARTREWYRAALDGAAVPDHITPVVSASGLERQIHWQGRAFSTTRDRTRCLVCLGRDITDDARVASLGAESAAERALHASEARLRRAQRVGRIGSWEYDVRTDTLEWSDEMYRITGLDARTVRPSRDLFLALVHPDDRGTIASATQAAMAGRLPECLVHRLLPRDGGLKWVENCWELERDEDGRVTGIVGTLQDVTDRWQADQELRRSRNLLSAVIDSSPDLIFAKDADHRFLFVNRAFAERRGATVETMLGRLDRDFWPADFTRGDGAYVSLRATDALALGGETTRQTLEVGSRAAGTWRAYDAIKRPLLDSEGRAYGILVYSRDTTEQQLLQDAQARALAEKEILLREIHHRVKNNLQVISSLLHFQAKKVSSPVDRAAFEDGRRRLLAMMLVHEKLYQVKDLAAIEFGLYARSLVTTLVATFDGGGRIETIVSAPDIRLPPDVAMPMGLVLCELVTNACKHAYPDDGAGRVEVSVARTPGEVVVEVGDTGRGMPEGFHPATARTFGWHLVTTLVDQLDARLDMLGPPGTRVRIALPLARTRTGRRGAMPPDTDQ
ncbi:MAG: PAS domain S-box protein [Vicinamibacterales bacterium]